MQTGLSIEIPSEDDNVNHVEEAYQKYRGIINRVNEIKQRSISLKLDKRVVQCVRGEHLGTGSNSSVSIFSPCCKYVIKESIMLQKAIRKSGSFDEETVDQVADMIDDSENEPENIRNFCALSEVFPKNILQLHNCFQTRNSENSYQNNFIMDRVKGKVLTRYFKSSDISVPGILALFLQSLYVILYSNLNGIFHNDLKANNIMVPDICLEEVSVFDQLVIGTNTVKLVTEPGLPYPVFIDYSISRKRESSNSPTPIEYYQIVKIFKEGVKLATHMSEVDKDNVVRIISLFDNFGEELVVCSEFFGSINDVRIMSPANCSNLPPLSDKTVEKITSSLQTAQQVMGEHVGDQTLDLSFI